MIIGILLWLNGANRAVAQVVLTGHTTAIQVLDEKTSVVVIVNLELTLKNESGANVILYWHDLDIVGNSLFLLDEKQNREVLYRSSTLPSTNRSPEWTDLQNRLNTQSPSTELTRILKSGESITVQKITSMTLHKNGHYPASWSEIQAASPLWLTVTLDMFPSNLDKTPTSQASFGESLQRKWKSIGTLQLRALESEAIRLDLGKR